MTNYSNRRKFYLLFRNEKVNAMCSQLNRSHYRELLKLKEKYRMITYYEMSKLLNEVGGKYEDNIIN